MKPQVHLTSGAFDAPMERIEAAHLLHKLRKVRNSTSPRRQRIGGASYIFIPGFTLTIR